MDFSRQRRLAGIGAFLGAAFSCGLLWAVHQATPQDSPKPKDSRVEEQALKLISAFSSDSAEDRENATKKLKEMGITILPLLRGSLGRAKDKETESRLKDIIKDLERRERAANLLPAEYLDEGKIGAKDGLLVFLGEEAKELGRDSGSWDPSKEECDKIIREQGGELVHYFRKYFHHLTGRPCLVKAGRLTVKEVSKNLSTLKETRFIWQLRDGEIAGGTPYFNPGFNARKCGVGLRFSKGMTEEKAKDFLEMAGIPDPGTISLGKTYPECYVRLPAIRKTLISLLILDLADEIAQIIPNWVER